jgi:hypothetical protein
LDLSIQPPGRLNSCILACDENAVETTQLLWQLLMNTIEHLPFTVANVFVFLSGIAHLIHVCREAVRRSAL